MTLQRIAHTRWAIVAAGALVALAGCIGSPDAFFAELPDYTVSVTASDFTEGITHSFLPYVAGSSWTYHIKEGIDGDEVVERIEVVVLEQTHTIMGVDATVVRDTVYAPDGSVVENTHDWYAQDLEGNVWYLGEDTCEFEAGQCVNTGGSFEWGVDGALPGIVMHANPSPGVPYYQEFYKGEAVDRAQDMARGESLITPLGTFTDTVRTREWNPLHPNTVEVVVYAYGIGPVLKGAYDEVEDSGPEDDDDNDEGENLHDELAELELLVRYNVPGYGAGPG